VLIEARVLLQLSLLPRSLSNATGKFQPQVPVLPERAIPSSPPARWAISLDLSNAPNARSDL
jgi:hypothetical protein